MAVIEVSLLTVNEVAGVDPNMTAVAPVKLEPLIVTAVPPAPVPELGLTPVTAGAGWAHTTVTAAMRGFTVSVFVTDTDHVVWLKAPPDSGAEELTRTNDGVSTSKPPPSTRLPVGHAADSVALELPGTEPLAVGSE